MQKDKKLNKVDRVVLLLILIVYTVFSFINLGDICVPKTMPDMGEGEQKEYITYATLNEETEVDRLMYYKGLGTGEMVIYNIENGEAKEIGRGNCCSRSNGRIQT